MKGLGSGWRVVLFVAGLAVLGAGTAMGDGGTWLNPDGSAPAGRDPDPTETDKGIPDLDVRTVPPPPPARVAPARPTVRAEEPPRRPRLAGAGIPPGHLPPPGECRIWYPDRPPGHQPPPGSCATLASAVPPGARLIGR
jgi:hypothetical protein